MECIPSQTHVDGVDRVLQEEGEWDFEQLVLIWEVAKDSGVTFPHYGTTTVNNSGDHLVTAQGHCKLW